MDRGMGKRITTTKRIQEYRLMVRCSMTMMAALKNKQDQETRGS